MDIQKRIENFIEKQERIYLKPGEKPPEGIIQHRGKRGGLYYVPGLRGETREKKPEIPVEHKDVVSSQTYDVKGSTITYQELADGSIKAIRGKNGKKIATISQELIKELRVGGLVGLSQRYGDTLVGRAIFGMSQLIRQTDKGWVLKS